MSELKVTVPISYIDKLQTTIAKLEQELFVTRTQSQWIDINVDRPEPIQGNKVIGRNGDIVFDCEFDDGFWCSIGGDNMTHWMKLEPLPPKEQG